MKDVASAPIAVAGRASVISDFVALTKPRLNMLVVATSAAGYYLGAATRPDLLAMTQAVVGYRDKQKGGVLGSLGELKAVVDPAAVASLQDGFFASDFGVRNVEIVGPQVGKQLQSQAFLAVLDR